MSFKKKSVVFEPFILKFLEKSPIIFCDIGARDDIPEPWRSVENAVKRAIFVVGFEPDPIECEKLNTEFEGKRIYIPFAVWKSAEDVALNLAAVKSTSSIHPPNLEVIKEYEEENWRPRVTESEVIIKAVSLDEVYKEYNDDCDFMKIDTQGSEFEILSGARKLLDESCFGITLETWTKEVHKGQKLTHDIMKLMDENGFELFDVELSAQWKRKVTKQKLFHRKQVIGLDLLYLKKQDKFFENSPPIEKVVRFAVVADLWGCSDYAISILEHAKKLHYGESIIDNLISAILNKRGNQRIKNEFIRSIVYKLGRRFYGSDFVEYPSIH